MNSIDKVEVLTNEFCYLSRQWELFRALFMDSGRRSKRFFDRVPILFHHVKLAIFNDVVFGITRLLDPARTRAQSNLTFAHIREAHPELSAKLDPILDQLKALEAPMRQARDKTLAHLDLRTVEEPSLVPKFEVGTVTQAVDLTREFLAVVYTELAECSTSYRESGVAMEVALLEACIELGDRDPNATLDAAVALCRQP